MKSRRVIVLIVAVLLFGTSMLMAGGPVTPTIRANVPFAFRVGHQLMPAGQYQIVHYNTRDLLLIRSMNDKVGILVQSVRSGNYTGETAKLIFNRYGETYFLRQVWIPGTDANQLLRSKAEKEYASRWSEVEPTAVVAAIEK